MQVRWTLNALENLNDAVEYIAADNIKASAEVAQRIWDAAQMLARQPGVGRPGKVSGTREFVIPGLPYIMQYVGKEGVVIILRVMHTSMRVPKKFY